MPKDEIERFQKLKRALSFARETITAGTAVPSVLELAEAYLDVGEMIATHWKTISFLDDVFNEGLGEEEDFEDI